MTPSVVRSSIRLRAGSSATSRLFSASPAAIFLGAFVLPWSVASAEILVQSHEAISDPFSDIVDYSSNQSPESTFFFFESPSIGAIPKFDPALGTLVGVEIAITFDYGFEISLFGEDVVDEAFPHSFLLFLDGLEFGLYYQPSNESFFVNYLTDSQSFSLGLVDEDSTFGASSTNDFSDYTFFMGSEFIDDSTFLISDFQGTGDVEGLRLGILVPTTGTFSIENLEQATATLEVYLDEAFITIDYLYVVPEPSAYALMLGLASVAFVAARRRRRNDLLS